MSREKRRADLNRAKVRHAALLDALGGHCVLCEVGPEGDLSIDHINGRDWPIRSLRYDARVGRYWREHLAGVALRVLCRSCNSIEAARVRREAADLCEAPF